MEYTLNLISERKRQLDALSPLSPLTQKELDEWFKVELTYSSNAIEGNTLTRIETAEVLSRGVAAVISGKPLKDQLEAVNHAKALEFIKQLAKTRRGHQFITEQDIKDIHKIILSGIDDNWAGVYRQTEVFIRGSEAQFPQPHAVPYAMGEFINWLSGIQGEHPVKIAADAHFKLVTIHPFIDGSGRTSRLLMNLVLIMHGYPMTVIRNEDRVAYLETFNQAREKKNLQPFYDLVEMAVLRSLDAYLNTQLPIAPPIGKLLQIGELAKVAKETVHTLRFWTNEGLLKTAGHTKSGYQLYDRSAVGRIKETRRLQKEERLTVSEIKKRLD